MIKRPENNKAAESGDIADALYEWCDALVSAIAVIIVLFTLLCKMTVVVGTSMVQTLQPNDTLIISRLFYKPAHQDIVVISIDNEYFSEPIVKRVIALGGETVDIDFATGRVSVTDVDGETRVLSEDYINTLTTTAYDVEFPLYVPEGYLFVMGDNRNGSTDSRDSRIGLIDERAVMGKVLFRLLPLKEIGSVK